MTLKEACQDPEVKTALMSTILDLEQSIGVEEVADGAPEIASVRVLSRQQGERRMLEKLREACTPAIADDSGRDEIPTFGNDLTQEQAKAAQAIL